MVLNVPAVIRKLHLRSQKVRVAQIQNQSQRLRRLQLPRPWRLLPSLLQQCFSHPKAGQVEWAADSGAGRHLTSFEALSDQGYDRSFFDGFSHQSHETLRFSTGSGQKDTSLSIGFQDRNGLFGKANHFILDSCPMVRSIGLDVEQDGLGFIWLPGCKPYCVRNPAECHVSCSEDNKFYASRVSQNALLFQSNFEVIPGVPAAVEHPAGDFHVETPPELLEEPVVPDPSVESAVEPGDLGERSSRAAEVREVAPRGTSSDAF